MTEQPSGIEAAALKLCPFCGGEPILLKDHKKLGFYVACTTCHVCGITGVKSEVTAAWNTRTRPAASGDLRERIARIVDPVAFNVTPQMYGLETEEQLEAQYMFVRCGRMVALAKADAIIAALPGLDEALASLPAGLNWLIGKGRTRPDEPLYGVQLIDPESGIVVGETEHDDLSEAVSLAIRSLKTGSGS